MSAELLKARTSINKIQSYLKQEKLLPAVLSLYEALNAYMSASSLLKKEREEFEEVLERAVYNLGQDANLKKTYPLVLQYEPGKEQDLIAQLKELCNELQDSVVGDARELLAEMERKKKAYVKKGREHLHKEEYDRAKRLFEKAVVEYSEDVELKAEIAESFYEAGRYEDAVNYLQMAIKEFPGSAYLYNRLAIAHRKLKQFAESEENFLKALDYAGDQDAILYFNMGRLYIDWKRWDKAEEAAQSALKANPKFVEAQKMLNFTRKKLSQSREEAESE